MKFFDTLTNLIKFDMYNQMAQENAIFQNQNFNRPTTGSWSKPSVQYEALNN